MFRPGFPARTWTLLIAGLLWVCGGAIFFAP
ncbi:MAG: hypothetical protein HW394_1352, partial [Acidobacteria bacterium]|nr:hypothetical protein [Acidobacteriota bacterium]